MIRSTPIAQDISTQENELLELQGLQPGVLVSFESGEEDQVLSLLLDQAGLQAVAHSRDYANDAVDVAQVSQDADVIIFDRLGVAVLTADPEQAEQAISLSTVGTAITAIEPEPIFYAFGGLAPDLLPAYLEGYRDAVNHLYTKLSGTAESQVTSQQTISFQDTATHTWGLAATGVDKSSLSGQGVRVAVLDTGLDLKHPDFLSRTIIHQSFIPGQDVQDGNGHGTHCVGTACGPLSPGLAVRRYGIAYEAELYVGKVLSNQGRALGRSTLSGIEWAISQGCQVVSLSLGGAVKAGQGYSIVFDHLGQRALSQNCLLIAAAGNDSRRERGVVVPVSSPANCPSFMAVAAVDDRLQVADFSNGGINPQGGRVDIAGPGVAVYSSAPDPANSLSWQTRYDSLDGTSMATPHVAGIAALLRQANPSLSADQLWRLLTSTAMNLPLSAQDVGAGLIKI